MSNDCIPYYDDGDHITGYCLGPVTGKTFVKIGGDRSGGTFSPSASLASDKGAPNISTADAGGRAFGVASYDGTTGAFIDVVRGSKMVVPVTAAAPFSAFEEVGVGPGGRAVPIPPEGQAVKATLVTGIVGNKNSIKWTAQTAGGVGNAISVAIVAATSGHAAGTFVVNGEDITAYADLTPSTGTTAQAIIDAANADANVSALVTAANNSTSDGTGVVAAAAKASLAGGTEGGLSQQAVGYVITGCANGADAQVSLY